MFSGITTALDLPWRPGVRKVVLVIADAPGKDPEPVTGLTLGQVRDHALAVDPAQVYTVEFGADPSAQTFMQSVSDATGGRFTSADSTTTLVDTLKSAIVQAGSAPTASAGGPYTGLTSDAVVLSSAASRDASEPIAAYDWDFDGDGVYDVTSADPVVRHTYAAAGTYNVVLRARAASGLSGLATSTVTVIDPPAGPPATPTNLTATPGDTTATLSWSAGPGPLASWFVIRDGSGNVLDVVGADASGNPPAGWVDPALVNGTHYTYTLSAGNQVGESIQAGPVTVTPATSAPAQPYRFEGFYSPVVNGMLSGTAGRTVPLKWRLWKANGIPVTSLGAVTGVRFSRPGATTSLAYDKQYELIVKTPRAWARSRVTVDVALSDGTTHRAILVLK
jgi:hypothetical protein